MPGDPKSAARERLLELLADSIGRSLELERLLGGELGAMDALDSEALHTALGAKRRCVEVLRSLDKRRSAECSSAGFPPGPAQMDQMCGWCDRDSAVREAWTDLLAIAIRCQQLNDTIGAVIRARRSQVSNGLAVLCGTDNEHGTYGRDAGDRRVTRPRNLARA